MRSLEIPAIGACMLVEDTEEHRNLFGGDGESVVYFRDPKGMVECARRLLADEPKRRRLAEAVYARIHAGHHTYADRLSAMLNLNVTSALRVEGGRT
jgi:spore maturation protein CgeB